MSDEKKVSNVGVIGATYHDKKEDKDCKIVSRDEKCKTVMLEYEDGTSKPVGYSTFRRQFKKVAGPVKEVVEGEDKVVDMKKAGKKVREKAVKLFDIMKDKFTVAGESAEGMTVTFNGTKRLVIISMFGYRMIDMYAKPNSHKILVCMKEEDFDAMEFPEFDVACTTYPKWKLPATFLVDETNIDSLVSAILNYVTTNSDSIKNVAEEVVAAEKKAEEDKLAKKAKAAERKPRKKKADKEAEQSVETEPVEESVEADTTTEDSCEDTESAE